MDVNLVYHMLQKQNVTKKKLKPTKSSVTAKKQSVRATHFIVAQLLSTCVTKTYAHLGYIRI